MFYDYSMLKKILVVEDDEFLVSAYEMKLAARKCEYKTAMNGKEALKVLETFRPDVILMDLVMPQQNGMDTLKAIKADSKLQDIPVYISSNLGYNDDIAKCMALGAVDYYIKSDVNLDDLLDKVLGKTA